MSEANIEAVREVFEAFARRDVERVLELVDPDIEFEPASTASWAEHPGSYHGHDGIRSYFEDVSTVWREIELDPREYRAIGENTVLVRGHVRASRVGGEREEGPAEWIWKLRAGKVVAGYAFPAETDRS